MDETKTPKKETNLSANSKETLTPTEPSALMSIIPLTDAEERKVKTIKRVYIEQGQLLDEKRKAKLQREKDDISRVIWPIRAVYISWIFWLLLFAIYPPVVNIPIAQILLMANGFVVLGVYFYKTLNLRKPKRKSAKERMAEEGEKAAQELVSSNKRLLKVADESILKEIELKQKSELSLIEARFSSITNTLKNMIPGVIALAVLFGISKPTEDTSTVGRILAFLGATVTLIVVSVEVLAQRYIIEKKECIAMLEQAHAEADCDNSSARDVTTEREG